MGKLIIKLLSNGEIKMETSGIKGEKCMYYAKIFEHITDAKISQIRKTQEYYENENFYNEDIQNLQE